MKKLMMMTGLMSMVALAATEKINGVEWMYSISNGVVRIGSSDFLGEAAIPRDTAGEIVIPEKLGGVPLKGITEWAFARNCAMTSVVVPAHIKYIGHSAFLCCENLRKVTFANDGKGSPSVGGAAFMGCKNLEEFVLPQNDIMYKTVDGALCNRAETKLIVGVKNGKIPSGIKEIMYGAFAGKDITKAVIPEGVTTIGMFAFMSCERLSHVVLPASVTNISEMVFTSCTNLQAFSVARNNPKYKAVEGCLCSKDGSVLLCGTSGAAIVPSCVEHIVGEAFFQNAGLFSVTIPPSVTKIDRLAFNNCTALKMVFTAKGDSERVKGLYKWDEGIKFVEK